MPSDAVTVGADGRPRCFWAVGGAPDYLAYHDEEGGRPALDDARLFERLTLEAFQSGLSWLTIPRKRPAFRAAFAGFDIAAVAAFSEADGTRLLADAGIVRHRLKIEAEVTMGFMDKAKQMAQEAAAKAKVAAADLQEKAGPAMEKAKQGAADLGEKAKPAFQQVEQELDELAEKAKPALEKARQDAGELAGKAKEKLSK